MTVPKLDKRHILTILGLIGAFLGGDVVGPLTSPPAPTELARAAAAVPNEVAELKFQLIALETREEERYLALQDRLTRIENHLDRANQ